MEINLPVGLNKQNKSKPRLPVMARSQVSDFFMGPTTPMYEAFVSTWRRKGRRQWQATPVLLPGESHGWRSLVGCSLWDHEESDTTERLHFHFSLSCIGEGNGNPLQCSCLENPRDGGAWWAAVYGVAQSQTRMKQLSSSSRRRKERLGTVVRLLPQLGIKPERFSFVSFFI